MTRASLLPLVSMTANPSPSPGASLPISALSLTGHGAASSEFEPPRRAGAAGFPAGTTATSNIFRAIKAPIATEIPPAGSHRAFPWGFPGIFSVAPNIGTDSAGDADLVT